MFENTYLLNYQTQYGQMLAYIFPILWTARIDIGRVIAMQSHMAINQTPLPLLSNTAAYPLL